MKKTTPAIRKTRNPQDATLRNTRALKARVAEVEQRLVELDAYIHSLADHIFTLRKAR